MAKPYKIPDFRKMYPEASEEVIAVLRTTERKMQYQEYDLKRARNIVDPKIGCETFLLEKSRHSTSLNQYLMCVGELNTRIVE